MAQQTTLIPLAARTSTLIVDSDLDIEPHSLYSGDIIANGNIYGGRIITTNVNLVSRVVGGMRILKEASLEGGLTTTNIEAESIDTSPSQRTLTVGSSTDIYASKDAESSPSGTTLEYFSVLPQVPTNISNESKGLITFDYIYQGSDSDRVYLYDGSNQLEDLLFGTSTWRAYSKVVNIKAGSLFQMRGKKIDTNKYPKVRNFRLHAVELVTSPLEPLV